MDNDLLRAVRGRLDGAGLDEAQTAMVVAACTGTPLEQAADAAWPDALDDDTATATAASTGVFLGGIAVEGFRGVGERRHLDLTPGPGLTVVVGRNGSGKSSFAEGLEMALTGESNRWADKPVVWKQSWRNLHAPDPCTIAVDVVLPPDGTTTITHRWDADADLDGGTRTLADGKSIDTLGWDSPLARYRPLLSFNELGGMFDGRPSDLYDAIAAILGVEPLREAVKAIAAARKLDDQPLKAVKKALPALQAQLRESDDPRADAILAALDGRKWDLLAATQAVQDDDTATPTSELNRLRALASQTSPAPLDATDAATALRESLAARDTATATDAGRADRLAAVLRAAVAHVTHDGTQPCPLCGSGTPLDDTWATQATQEADALAAQAKAVRDADTALRAATTAARRLLPAVPDALLNATFVGLDAQPAIDAWEALLDAPDDPAALAGHLEQAVPALDQAVTALRKEAAATLDQRQSDWRPIAAAVTRWIDDAHAGQAADARAKVAKQAEKWLSDTATAIEAERFEPIRDAVQGYWDRLRLQSNVALNDLSLKRSGNQRSLVLDVAVDDSDASALGVMSQGELHALALSVFLPRATLDESPFRFVVLDDPVQAMDPAKVEGLAAVLADVAQTRQVIVLTHDTRLPDAVRDLQIPARIVEVHRRSRSQVQLRTVTDPVERHLADSRAIARTEDLPAGVRARLVAQMGRGALEAVSMEVVRRRRLGRGDRHEQVEEALAGSKVHDLVTLALFDDPRRSSDVFPTLNRWARELADAFADCKRGTHVGERTIDDPTFVRHVGELVERIRREAA